MNFVIWLAIASFTGAVLTFTYTTILYALSPIGRRGATLIAVLLALATIIGLFRLAMSDNREVDAGGLLLHVIFAVAALALGGPLGSCFSAR